MAHQICLHWLGKQKNVWRLLWIVEPNSTLMTSCFKPSFNLHNFGRKSLTHHKCILARLSHSSVRHYAQLPAQQGLFHVKMPDLDEGKSSSKSVPENTYIGKPNVRESEVQYLYNKEMISASQYMQREREKLMSEPRSHMESFHSKYTPRLFYLEREQYKSTAVCLPREDLASVDMSHKEFLDKIMVDKHARFPISDIMDCIKSLGLNSDEWLIDMNNDVRFLRLCIIIKAVCNTMTTDELAEVLTLLARAQIRTRNYVLPTLYQECCNRVGSMDLRTRLLVLDSWRMIGYPVPRFCEEAFAACRVEVPKMNTAELLQLIYLIGENRGAPDGLEESLVKQLPDHLTSLSLTELGTVCTGLFKSHSSPQTSDLMLEISDHVCSSDIQSVHSFFIVGILKHFRRQYAGYQHFFQYVANAVAPFLHLYPLMSCMQILLTYATMHICHPQLCDNLANEITHRADEWRSKDATKILWSFGTLQYLPDKPYFLPTVLEQLVDLQGEMEEYPLNLVSSLLSLAYLQRYPWELINRLFSKEFLQTVTAFMDKTGVDLRRDMLLLDRSLEIECPQYNGNRLDESIMLRSEIHSSIAPTVGQQMANRPDVRFIAGLVRAAVGRKENYKIHSILPHFNTLDIEVRLDEHNQLIPFEPSDPLPGAFSQGGDDDSNSMFNNRKLSSDQKCKNAVALSSNLIANMTKMTKGGDAPEDPSATGVDTPPELKNVQESPRRVKDKRRNVKRILQKPVPAPSQSNEKWLAIVVWARNHSHYGGHKLLGQHAMKRRQLELLGYQVLDVPFQEWSQMMKNRDQQENIKHIKRKIFNNSHSSL
ncbi:FAST kinase domain-containing protein 5, mitochondrial-like [Lytechinus variegatus]|uniref:FAST kinase domain-containing protein 5, mitochondrial-like n=1 Tax=Lytechinus variegatus TaxID=7654 RepID=UPI001BB23770|nr:FAST kinase domain-containing protein 5, mitochondrial-like [Lytechinus variegatus]